MFQAVRQWWGDGGGKRITRLFAFEFVVVMAGVLAAQGLANLVENRAAQRRLDAALDRINRDVGYNMAAAQAWRKAAPCLDERMILIMRSASAETPLEPTDWQRPSIRMGYFDPLSEEDDLLLRERGQEELADTIQQFDSSVNVMSQRLREMTDLWTAFELLDPDYGPVLREDRVEARHNASAIRANLRGVAVGAEGLLQFGKAIGAEAIYDPGERVASDCAEIWSSGQTMIVGKPN
jgi:hypothetical protein